MKICAVVVAYDPDQEFVDRLGRIAWQSGGVVVVDNSPSAEGKHRVDVSLMHCTCALIRNEMNVGLGQALNQGIAWARTNGYSHVLLFDQDSMPHQDMAYVLEETWHKMGSELAILGSNFLERRSGRRWLPDSCVRPHQWQSVSSLTTSGMLLPLATVEQLGPFCEALFVDLVDMEFSLRAKTANIRFGATCQVLMTHEVGRMKREKILGRTVWPAHHSAQRRYFMARNTILLLKKYGKAHTRWAATAVVSLAKSLALVLLFEEYRWQKFRSTMSGLVDGMLMGRHSCPHESFKS